MTTHADHDHEATRAARAACRKAIAAAEVADHKARTELVRVLNKGYQYSNLENGWLFYAARRFADYRGSDLAEAVTAVQSYFYPSGDQNKDDYRRRNGYTITDNPYTIRSIIVRAAS